MNNEPIFLWRDPKTDPPAWTGKILVKLHDGDYDLVRVEEGFMEYCTDEAPADCNEWEMWTRLSK